MRGVKAFRLVALAYAISVLLIAPAQLVADTLVADDDAAAPQQAAAPAPVPAAEPGTVAPAPEPAAPTDEAPVVVDQQAEAPAADPAPVAKTSKKDDAQSDEPVAHAAASGSVTISDFKFTPATITVNVGDTVTWTNNGPTPHSATAKDGSFDTGIMDKGKSGSATFNNAGTIPYICTPHPFMKGTVIVKAAASSTPSAGSDTTDDTAGATDSGTADDSSDLPNTGGETLLIALLGLLTLAAGLWLRRGPRKTSRT